MKTELANAFRFHLQNTFRAYGDNRPRAVIALDRARQDVANGKARYPQPVRVTYRQENDGLRLVGRVVPEPSYRNGVWDARGDCGWHTDPHGDVFKDGSGLCYGVVYQLPGRKGESRFVAGYEFGGVEGGPTLDLGTIYASPDNCSYDGAQGNDAARDAARAADGMAQKAAEDEREYQTAWAAGSRFADEAIDVASTRQEVLAILKERRALRGQAGYPALCGAITARVQTLLDCIAMSRRHMAELAAGDYRDLIFWNGEKRLQDAFCEGAGLDSFPA